jgi:diacylglycerol kinase family enzyme
MPSGFTVPRPPDVSAPRRVALVMNARSGGGKVGRFGLEERARSLGARVALVGPAVDAASLARAAVVEGAEVLGVAGGDGTVSSVAAVAVETGRPLLVMPAGTRNHFARDLGLDIRDPAAALAALEDGEQVEIDLGFVGERPFVNNVSLGAYADALLSPSYREAKAQALASAAGPYLEGRQWVDVRVDTPAGPVARPQVVLVSNNPYHLASPRYVGRRFGLDRGVLGAVVVRRADRAVPAPLPQLVRDLAEGRATPDDGLITWSAPRLTLEGEAGEVAAGVDGEAVRLTLPVTCEIRPRALSVLLPRNRPGIPREPEPWPLPAGRAVRS